MQIYGKKMGVALTTSVPMVRCIILYHIDLLTIPQQLVIWKWGFAIQIAHFYSLVWRFECVCYLDITYLGDQLFWRREITDNACVHPTLMVQSPV